jgi:hypothetical protein
MVSCQRVGVPLRSRQNMSMASAVADADAQGGLFAAIMTMLADKAAVAAADAARALAYAACVAVAVGAPAADLVAAACQASSVASAAATAAAVAAPAENDEAIHASLFNDLNLENDQAVELEPHTTTAAGLDIDATAALVYSHPNIFNALAVRDCLDKVSENVLTQAIAQYQRQRAGQPAAGPPHHPVRHKVQKAPRRHSQASNAPYRRVGSAAAAASDVSYQQGVVQLLRSPRLLDVRSASRRASILALGTLTRAQVLQLARDHHVDTDEASLEELRLRAVYLAMTGRV